MSTSGDQSPCRQDPQQDWDESRLQLSHPDIFTGHGSPRPNTELSPILPSSANEGNCQQLACPLRFPHQAGLYQHMNQPSPFTDVRPHFGSSNPPPEIWMARQRIVNNRGSEADFTSVVAFIRAHYVEWTDAERQQWQEQPAIDHHSMPHGYDGEQLDTERKEDNDMEMEDLAEEMAGVDITQDNDHALQVPFQIYTNDPPISINNSSFLDSLPPPRVNLAWEEAEMDQQIDRQLEEAFLDLEMEETQEAAARMDINDDADKENDAPWPNHSPHPPPPLWEAGQEYEPGDRPLRELIKEAYRICVEVGDELARDEDEDIL
ncbi:MAG: hypothetical protein Q9216_004001 [Gyalolechia sp. 2 TL-2023]